jgi:hypothetical protein
MTPWPEEFAFALHLAYEIGVTKPLRNYVASGKPIPQDVVLVKGHSTRQDMASLVAELLGCPPDEPPPKRGRPHRIAGKASAIEQAERNAAWLVAFRLKAWREHNKRKRVPSLERKQIIADARAKAVETFKVPLDAIKTDNIHNLLKSGRIVVH